MMLTDPAIPPRLGAPSEMAVRIAGIAGAILVVIAGKLLQKRAKAHA
jgi:hypothetical protein